MIWVWLFLWETETKCFKLTIQRNKETEDGQTNRQRQKEGEGTLLNQLYFSKKQNLQKAPDWPACVRVMVGCSQKEDEQMSFFENPEFEIREGARGNC